MKNEDIKEYIKTTYDFWYTSNRFYCLWAKQYKITDLALFTLDTIYSSKECTQNFITERLSISKQTVCSILNNFLKKGYIKKKINPKDKRNKLISLTKKGNAFSKPILEELEKLDILMIKCMSENEIKNYIESQKKLIIFMENYFGN